MVDEPGAQRQGFVHAMGRCSVSRRVMFEALLPVEVPRLSWGLRLADFSVYSKQYILMWQVRKKDQLPYLTNKWVENNVKCTLTTDEESVRNNITLVSMF